MISGATRSVYCGTLDRESEATCQLYVHARSLARWNRFKALFTGRSPRLFDLAEVQARGRLVQGSDAGFRTVPIDQIRGSENRAADFDSDFNPVQNHTRQRWLRVAEARYWGRALPPVELLQIGGVYFVRDGHHRISVARALGQEAIDARVTLVQVNGPLPWERRQGREPFLGCP